MQINPTIFASLPMTSIEIERASSAKVKYAPLANKLERATLQNKYKSKHKYKYKYGHKYKHGYNYK